MKRIRVALLLAAPVWLVACSSTPPAPSVERKPVQVEKPLRPAEAPPPAEPATTAVEKGVYTVKKNDTLYSIALEHGQDYKDVAAWNNLEDPNKIKIGQQLRVTPSAKVAEPEPVAVAQPIALAAPVEVRPVATKPGAEVSTELLKREPKGGKVAYSAEALARARNEPPPAKVVEAPPPPRPVEVKPAEPPVAAPAAAAVASGAIEWAWPISGKLLANFVDGTTKGIDIAGNPGDPVLTAAPGKVVYAGEGLRGYGKLVIVRHNAEFLSAYAHNSQILVKEGETVVRRQKIALVGSTDAESPRLHFEVRRQGKPVDPLKYLPAK